MGRLKVATNKKIVKIGDSFALIIDKAYVNNEQINLDKKYDVYVEEADENN